MLIPPKACLSQADLACRLGLVGSNNANAQVRADLHYPHPCPSALCSHGGFFKIAGIPQDEWASTWKAPSRSNSGRPGSTQRDGPRLERLDTISATAEVMRDMLRSDLSTEHVLEASSPKLVSVAVEARVKGTYALKGIHSQPILSSILPAEVAQYQESLQTPR